MGGSCDKTTGPLPYSQVRGHVLDSATGAPIDSALIEAPPAPSVTDTFWIDITDSTGAYEVRLHIFGWNYIHCSKPGYVTDSVRVYYGGTVVNDDVDFLLVP
jgi:hypothetical protein